MCTRVLLVQFRYVRSLIDFPVYIYMYVRGILFDPKYISLFLVHTHIYVRISEGFDPGSFTISHRLIFVIFCSLTSCLSHSSLLGLYPSYILRYECVLYLLSPLYSLTALPTGGRGPRRNRKRRCFIWNSARLKYCTLKD